MDFDLGTSRHQLGDEAGYHFIDQLAQGQPSPRRRPTRSAFADHRPVALDY
jgi:hypothetical protein